MDDVLLGRERKYEGSSDEESAEDEALDRFEDSLKGVPQNYDNSVAFGGAKVRILNLLNQE